MNLMGSLKKKVGEFNLKKQIGHQKRNVKSCSLIEARKIGVLFDATHLVSFEIVKEFVKHITKPENEVMVLGYVDSKQMIDHYLYRKGFEFFTKSNLNWYNKPEGEAVNDFIAQKFDILIDLNLEDSYPMNHISSASHAVFKAGRFSPDNKILDFMLDIEPEKKALKQLQVEIDKDRNVKRGHSANYDNIAERKTDIELQLNYLINHLVHYLSKLK